MDLSIKQVAERMVALEVEAAKIWTDLAEALATRIPESCRKFASEKGWYKSEIDNWWDLPKFLKNTVSYTKLNSCANDKFFEKDLETYGFTSFDDLEIKLKDLEHAWAGLMRIHVRMGEDRRVEICYYAVEFEPGSDKA